MIAEVKLAPVKSTAQHSTVTVRLKGVSSKEVTYPCRFGGKRDCATNETAVTVGGAREFGGVSVQQR